MTEVDKLDLKYIDVPDLFRQSFGPFPKNVEQAVKWQFENHQAPLNGSYVSGLNYRIFQQKHFIKLSQIKHWFKMEELCNSMSTVMWKR